jgi:hypothetical protein
VGAGETPLGEHAGHVVAIENAPARLAHFLLESLDEKDASRLREIRLSAIDYLVRNFGFTFSQEIFNME